MGFGSSPVAAEGLCFNGGRRKGVVLVDLGHSRWAMVVGNHPELVFLGGKVPLCINGALG